MTLLARIAEDIGLLENDLKKALASAGRHIKLYNARKKSGVGSRRIVVPPREYKLIHYWLIRNRLRSIPVHSSATAFQRGCSIQENARRHSSGLYFVKLDIEDFFPSITADDFAESLRAHDRENHSDLIDSLSDSEFRRTLFYKDACAIGYPISPYIANLVMRDIDQQIAETLADNVEHFGPCTYTRYADDITISVDRKGYKDDVIALVRRTLERAPQPRLTLNSRKIRAGSRPAGTAFVTGLRICKDGHLTLHRRYKDKVRLLLQLYAKGRLNDDDVPSLIGHLNYCAYADPRFYTRLIYKHVEAARDLVPRATLGEARHGNEHDQDAEDDG